jgi:DNA invertase Pin-like site-specific DNA recombinase
MTQRQKTVALYLRVSSDDQTIDMQRRDLTLAAERHGWCRVAEFVDEGISGAKGRSQRPAFDRLCRAIARHEFDIVAAWSVDRLGRSLQDLVAFLGEVHVAGIGLYLDRQGLDTSTPAGKAMFQMLGVFAEFERAMIVQRVRAGIAKARAQGTRSGKAIGRPGEVPADKIAAVRAALVAGDGIRKVARAVGVGNGTVQQIARQMASTVSTK